MKTFELGGKTIGNGLCPFIIAEVGQAHDGSLGLAHCFIDAAAKAGVDAIKFQTHIAMEESTLDEPFRVKFSRQDDTRLDYWRRMEFTGEQWAGLAEHAKEKGLIFLSSAFSIAAVDLLQRLEIPAWKVGSGEFWSSQLLQAMIDTGKPLLVSTGMSRWDEIELISQSLETKSHAHALLQCTSRYPTKLNEVGLNVVAEMQNKLECPIGLSDHSGSIFPSIAAMARGVALIEVHITLSNFMFGPDISSSLTVDELSQLVAARDAFVIMDTNLVDKDNMAEELASMRSIFSKSITLAKDLPAGSVLEKEHLCLKKPGTGIPFSDLDRVVGKRLINDGHADCLLKWDNIE